MKRVLAVFILFVLSLVMFAQQSSDKLIRQGASYHDRGKYMEAISCYQQALKITPSSMSAVYEMSLSYLKMRDYENAIRHSTQVINVGFRPLLVDAYVVKGTALAAQNKMDQAIASFSEAIIKSGSEYILHYNLGLCYYNNKNSNLALLHLRKAIELDATHSEAFLLYAYVLKDTNRWLQSFYSFHFFLLLEPNTKRSNEAFSELYGIISQKLEEGDKRLEPEDGLDRQRIYKLIQQHRPSRTDRVSQYEFFVDGSKEIFSQMNAMRTLADKGFFWDFFVSVYGEIFESGHYETYCRYISVSYFTESFKWWDTHKEEVDSFIDWFEHGTSPDLEEDAYFDEDESDEDVD